MSWEMTAMMVCRGEERGSLKLLSEMSDKFDPLEFYSIQCYIFFNVNLSVNKYTNTGLVKIPHPFYSTRVATLLHVCDEIFRIGQ